MSTTAGVHTPHLVRYAVGWGVGLWLIGYVLGIIAFALVPTWLIGWIIMPIGVLITVWALLQLKHVPLWFYGTLSVVWTVIAVTFDYLFIVRAFAPADGYYKLDVYIYYFLTFTLPLVFGWRTNSRPLTAA
jgi:hypothetical protein